MSQEVRFLFKSRPLDEELMEHGTDATKLMELTAQKEKEEAKSHGYDGGMGKARDVSSGVKLAM